jgi:hypothetical protein
MPTRRSACITGDLAHRGEPPPTRASHASSARLSMPVYPLLGNHDKRAPFHEALPQRRRTRAGFVASGAGAAEGDFLFLDTLDEGVNGGKYCDARAAWLLRASTEAAIARCFLSCTTTPFAIGIPCLDAISLAEPTFAKVIGEPAQHPATFFYGHCPRPVCGRLARHPGLHHARLETTRCRSILETVTPVPKSHEPRPTRSCSSIRTRSRALHRLPRSRTLVKVGDHYEYAP